MSNAAAYAGLVGKYIRMSRPATEEEQSLGEPPTVGMECLVAQVSDLDGDALIEIVSDYGIAFTVDVERCEWSFTIWPDEQTARHFRGSAVRS